MERKIGEIFTFKRKKLLVRENIGCEGCFFKSMDCSSEDMQKVIGLCSKSIREDKKTVIFVEYNPTNIGRQNEPVCGQTPERSILEEAIDIVNGSRNTDYGNPVESFKRIAQLSNLMSNRDDLTPIDCCNVLLAVKLTRESNAHKRDNLVDMAGYAHIKQLLEEDKENG